LMDFTNTKMSFGRSIWTYSKVQAAIGMLIRNRSFQKWNLSLPYMNVGCGPFPLDGFCNIDYGWAPGVVSWDITRNFPLPSQCLKGIYTEHCLEHISFEECKGVLQEFHRLLKPGGVARIVVPDAEVYCSLYMQTRSGAKVVFPYPEEDKTPAYYLNRIM